MEQDSRTDDVEPANTIIVDEEEVINYIEADFYDQETAGRNDEYQYRFVIDEFDENGRGVATCDKKRESIGSPHPSDAPALVIPRVMRLHDASTVTEPHPSVIAFEYDVEPCEADDRQFRAQIRAALKDKIRPSHYDGPLHAEYVDDGLTY